MFSKESSPFLSIRCYRGRAAQDIDSNALAETSLGNPRTPNRLFRLADVIWHLPNVMTSGCTWAVLAINQKVGCRPLGSFVADGSLDYLFINS